MAKLLSSPLSLSSTSQGFSVVDSQELTQKASDLVLEHISSAVGGDFESLKTAAEFVIRERFDDFKDKQGRIFPSTLAEAFLYSLVNYGYLNPHAGDFVTDEENLGFPNIYWRLVRKNSSSDVGPIHADRWFWDLSKADFPRSHTRVKVWMPLYQDDLNPSLLVLPGSQNQEFDYSSRRDSAGKTRPVFENIALSQRMKPAPVRVGQAIVFHDSLLHGGRVTRENRVSVEFTLAKAPSSYA